MLHITVSGTLFRTFGGHSFPPFCGCCVMMKSTPCSSSTGSTAPLKLSPFPLTTYCVYCASNREREGGKEGGKEGGREK